MCSGLRGESGTAPSFLALNGEESGGRACRARSQLVGLVEPLSSALLMASSFLHPNSYSTPSSSSYEYMPRPFCQHSLVTWNPHGSSVPAVRLPAGGSGRPRAPAWSRPPSPTRHHEHLCQLWSYRIEGQASLKLQGLPACPPNISLV